MASSSLARSSVRALESATLLPRSTRFAVPSKIQGHVCSYATSSTSTTASSTSSAASQTSSATASSNATSQPESPSSSPLPAQQLSPLKQSFIKGVAKVMGYNNRTATAIRTTSDYYDRCSERDEREGAFFYDECGLPKSYQSWMQITNLHIWLLSVRFRSLPAPLGKSYIQEMINHYFIHSETLMRSRYDVKQSRLIKGYLRDMLYQYHGANMGYDEGLVSENDAILTAAVWRNLFGAGWGKMGGVKGKLNQDKTDGQTSAAAAAKSVEENPLADLNLEETAPPTPSPTSDIPNQSGGHHLGGSGLVTPLPPFTPQYLKASGLDQIQSKEARFALNLERLVLWIRSEVNRMEKIPDEVVVSGQGVLGNAGESARGSLTAFSRI